MTADTLYWLYSTIAQTLGAILGVGGMVCVFRLGTLRGGRWRIVERMSQFCFHVIGDYAPPAKKILEECEDLQEESKKIFDLKGKRITIKDNGVLIEKGNESTSISGVNPKLELSKLKEIVQEEDKIRPAFIRFLRANLVIIGLSIAALIFSEKLAATPRWIGAGAIGLTVLATAYSLHLTIQLCIAVIPGGKRGKKDCSK